jgi:putative dehydrogenase
VASSPTGEYVGIIGIGAMGEPLAANLVAGGFRVVGFGGKRVERWVKVLEDLGGEPAGSPAEVAARAEISIICLPGPAALRDVIHGKGGIISSGRTGGIFIETSTFPVPDKEEARKALAEVGMGMVDCPISGTGDMARRKDLVFYASGPEDLLERCRPVFEATSRYAPRVGDFGAGTKMKLVSNLLVSVHTVVAGEALTLAAKCGLDVAMTFDLLCAGSGTSRMLEVRGPLMVADDYPGTSAEVRTLSKDVEIIMDLATSHDCPVPLLATASTYFNAARGQGLGANDPAIVARVLAGLAGLDGWPSVEPLGPSS